MYHLFRYNIKTIFVFDQMTAQCSGSSHNSQLPGSYKNMSCYNLHREVLLSMSTVRPGELHFYMFHGDADVASQPLRTTGLEIDGEMANAGQRVQVFKTRISPLMQSHFKIE